MNKIINTQDALDAIDANVGILYDSPTLVTSLKKMVNGLPPVDAVPVRRGRWIDIDAESYTWKIRCSRCGHERSMLSTGKTYPMYCENCGARMDGEGNGNEAD